MQNPRVIQQDDESSARLQNTGRFTQAAEVGEMVQRRTRDAEGKRVAGKGQRMLATTDGQVGPSADARPGSPWAEPRLAMDILAQPGLNSQS
jgi:hypothetical protein